MVKKKNSLTFISEDYLLNKIYLLREEKVMLDRDLALLYDVKSIRLREQVKRYGVLVYTNVLKSEQSRAVNIKRIELLIKL